MPNHPHQPKDEFRLPVTPEGFPGLIAFWDFQRRTADGGFPAVGGEPYVLRERAGAIEQVADPGAPFGKAIHLREGQWLSIDRKDCPRLDIHGTSHLFLVAWLKRGRTASPHCEFIAGQWNETDRSRQYGLFLNISVWTGVQNTLCGHLSTTGGPTTGYQYCMDGPMGASVIDHDSWHAIAMSYDGQQGCGYLDGRLDARPGLNPYVMPGGLHDGGPGGSDFTVGAVDRSGEIGNFYTGLLGGLAVYDRVPSPAAIWALCRKMPET